MVILIKGVLLSGGNSCILISIVFQFVNLSVSTTHLNIGKNDVVESFLKRNLSVISEYENLIIIAPDVYIYRTNYIFSHLWIDL